MIKLEYASLLVPTLVTSDRKLRLRKQQDKHRTIASKAVVPYLRKVKKAAEQTLFLAAEGPNKEVPPSSTTQAEIQTKPLQLPKFERTISLQEHDDMIEGYELYSGYVAEKIRLDLAFLHTTAERFVETALKHEQRLGAMCMFIQETANKQPKRVTTE